MAELSSTLELVQNQRNDLRQQFRVRAAEGSGRTRLRPLQNCQHAAVTHADRMLQ